MNQLNIIYGKGGLNAQSPSEDLISGLLFYSTVTPFGFSANSINQIFSVAEAEAFGIVLAAQVSASTITDVMHYHIAEFFRGNPVGNLFVGVSSTGDTAYTAVTTMQNFATGKIRQIGVYEQLSATTANISSLQAQATALEAVYMPLEIIYQPDFSTVSNLTTLANLHSLTAKNVAVCIGQDGAAVGKALYNVIGKSIGTVGIALGTLSSANVANSIAWVGAYNLDNGTELDTLAFANGTLHTSLTTGQITNIDTLGYIFPYKIVGISGSYFNNDYTAVALTSDYAHLNLDRTIHKAGRTLRTFLLPQLASPIYFNKDGTLRADTIGLYETICSNALNSMVSNKELSDFSAIINPSQNVLSTGILAVNVKLVPVGTADIINVNISFTLSL